MIWFYIKIYNKFIAFFIKSNHDLIYKSKLLKYLYLNYLFPCALYIKIIIFKNNNSLKINNNKR
jgi:hypothetical protein